MPVVNPKTSAEIISIQTNLYDGLNHPRGVIKETNKKYHDDVSEREENYRNKLLEQYSPESSSVSHLSASKTLQIDAWRKDVDRFASKKAKPMCNGCAKQKIVFKKYSPPATPTHSEAPLSSRQSKVSMHSSLVVHTPNSKKKSYPLKKKKNRQLALLENKLAELSLHYTNQRSDLESSYQAFERSSVPFGTKENGNIVYDITLKGRDSGVSSEGESELDSEVATPPQNTKPQISVRSHSNDLLHCVSIDDCRQDHRHAKKRVLSAKSQRSRSKSPAMLPPTESHPVTPALTFLSEDGRHTPSPSPDNKRRSSSAKTVTDKDTRESQSATSRKSGITPTTEQQPERLKSPYAENQMPNKAVLQGFKTVFKCTDVTHNDAKRGLFKYEKFANKKVKFQSESENFKKRNAILHDHIISAINDSTKRREINSRNSSAKTKQRQNSANSSRGQIFAKANSILSTTPANPEASHKSRATSGRSNLLETLLDMSSDGSQSNED